MQVDSAVSVSHYEPRSVDSLGFLRVSLTSLLPIILPPSLLVQRLLYFISLSHHPGHLPKYFTILWPELPTFTDTIVK